MVLAPQQTAYPAWWYGSDWASAINAALSSGAKHVVVPAYSSAYAIGARLEMTAGVLLELRGELQATAGLADYIIHADGVDGWEVRGAPGAVLDGNGSGGAVCQPVTVSDCSDFKISGLEVMDNYGASMLVVSGASHHFILRDLHLHGMRGTSPTQAGAHHGIRIVGGCNAFRLESCRVHDICTNQTVSTGDGVYIADSGDFMVNDCVISDVNRHGLSITHTSGSPCWNWAVTNCVFLAHVNSQCADNNTDHVHVEHPGRGGVVANITVNDQGRTHDGYALTVGPGGSDYPFVNVTNLVVDGDVYVGSGDVKGRGARLYSRAVVSNFQMNGGYQGLQLSAGGDIQLSNLRLQNLQRGGIYFGQDFTGGVISNLVVIDCNLEGGSTRATCPSGLESGTTLSDLIIDGFRIEDGNGNHQVGIELSYSPTAVDDVTIANGRIINTTGRSLAIRRGHGVRVHNVLSEGAGDDSFFFRDCDGCLVSACLSKSAGSDAFAVTDCTRLTFQDCTASSPSTYGWFFRADSADSQYLRLAGCHVSSAGSHGAFYDAVGQYYQNCTISGLTAESCTGAGLYTDGGAGNDYNVVVDCIVRGCGTSSHFGTADWGGNSRIANNIHP